MKQSDPGEVRTHAKTLRVLGILLFPAAWLVIKYGFSVPDRFLPGPIDVVQSAYNLSPPIFSHFAATAVRLGSGVILGAVFGIPLGAVLYASRSLRDLLTPVLISMQNVPPLAVVPFFILWFGFSEFGKFLIVFLAVAINLAMYGLRALSGLDPKYQTMIKSYQFGRFSALRLFFVPYILSVCLPTLRYVLSVSVGLVLFSELLGAQVGLGYLIQTARSTFSMSLVFLVAGISTLLYVLFDAALVAFWRRAFPWSVS